MSVSNKCPFSIFPWKSDLILQRLALEPPIFVTCQEFHKFTRHFNSNTLRPVQCIYKKKCGMFDTQQSRFDLMVPVRVHTMMFLWKNRKTYDNNFFNLRLSICMSINRTCLIRPLTILPISCAHIALIMEIQMAGWMICCIMALSAIFQPYWVDGRWA